MAVICARCGTQNPDGNQFCQACGTPLAVAAAAPGVSPAMPPPPGASLPGPPPMAPPPPGAYQSPYYTPSAVGPQPPVHRTPWVLIIAAIVVLILIMAGIGTAIAVLGHHNSGNQAGTGILPSPSPAGKPSPIPTPATSSSSTASNSGESFTLPAGWTVANKDDQSITVTDPNGNGSVTIESGPSSPPQTAQQNKDTIDKYFQGKFPDTAVCPGSKINTGTLNGAAGIFWVLCFTLTGSGQSVPAGAPLFAGASSDGSVYYVVFLLTSQSNMASFISAAAPILNSIHWKLT
jgi:zinc-ribbon domain